jgi:hypothetical protein
VWIDKGIASANPDSSVLNAKAKFLNQGGRWKSTTALSRAIHDALLGITKCSRI